MDKRVMARLGRGWQGLWVAPLLFMAAPAGAQTDVTTALVPNLAGAAYEAQSRLFSQDLQVVVSALAGYGVSSGCAVTPGSGMQVSVAAGNVRTPSGTVAVSSGALTVTAAHATNPRIDMVTVAVASGTKAITTGTAAATPAPPDVPRPGGIADVILAFVYVPAASSSIASNQIIDKRLPAGGGTGNVSAGTLTSNTIPKATGAAAIANSLLSDNGTTLTYTGSGGISAGGSGTGQIALPGATSGTVTLTTQDVAGTWTLKLPTSAGIAGEVFRTDGSGNATWVTGSRGLAFTIGDPAGSALTAGSTTTDYLIVPFACTLSAYNLAVDSGTITVKFWKIATGTAIPTSSNSISTSGVGISSGTAIHSTTMTDFTSTAVVKDDILAMNVTAVSGPKYVTATLQCDL